MSFQPFGEKVWPCVCIDLETLDTRPTARILEIGAVCFDPETQVTGPQFAFEVSARGQDARSIDLDTALWWSDRQWKDGIAMPGLARADGDLWEGMRQFHEFMKEHTDRAAVEVWAWGIDFDCGILRNAWDALRGELPLPWEYYRQRDARTLCEVLGVKRRGQVMHRALPDAAQEADAVMRALGIVSGLRERGRA